VKAWEREAEKVSQEVNLIKMRLGLVLGRDGGLSVALVIGVPRQSIPNPEHSPPPQCPEQHIRRTERLAENAIPEKHPGYN